MKIGKRTTVLAACGALAVLLSAFIYRNRIWSWYLEVHWKRIGVVVLGGFNADKAGGVLPRDGIRFLDPMGNELYFREGLNNTVMMGAWNAIAFDRERHRIYYCELGRGRLTSLDAAGNLIYRVESPLAKSISLDPKTGMLFCLSGHVDQGIVLVFDPAGNQVAAYPIPGLDLAYDPHADAFWVVGIEIIKFDREGKILARTSKIPLISDSLAFDSRDGSIWVTSRNEGTYTVGRVIRFDDQGKVVREIGFENRDIMHVACHPKTGMAWVPEYGKAILRITADGDLLPPIPIPAISVAISPTNGSIWVATKDKVMRIDPDGEILASYALDRPTSQVWLAAP